MRSLLKLPLKTKVLILIAFAAAGVAFLFVPSGLKLNEESEAEACEKRCSATGRSGELVRIVKSPVGSGKYQGPWNCECR